MTAKACPKCGAKIPHTKWWLWLPLGAIAAFLLYGLTIPEYVSRAHQLRDTCEKLAPFQRGECDRIYDRAMSEGRAAGEPAASRAYVPSAYDIAQQKKKSEQEAAERTVERAACKVKVAESVAEYKRLMAAGEYWSAAVSLRRCSQLLEDPKLAALVADGEMKSYIKDIENPKTPPADRIRFIEALSRDYPQAGDKYAPLLKKLASSKGANR